MNRRLRKDFRRTLCTRLYTTSYSNSKERVLLYEQPYCFALRVLHFGCLTQRPGDR